MIREMEYEAKSLLTKDDFYKIKQVFQLTSSLSQQNDYFDTPQFRLKKAGAALRIRYKESHIELTLKKPTDDGLEEFNQTIDRDVAKRIYTTNVLPIGDLSEEVASLIGSDQFIECFGKLTTNRMETPYKEGTLFLDHSEYGDIEDYEVEYEGYSMAHAQTVLTSLLTELHIKPTPAKSKIARFYEATFIKKNQTKRM
ncbi:uncharacterized protein YjbK [Alkalihalobacillus xiaoxiensis]|uniref:Uncharacterized protein YjbK n=1 Tax=Shouchella xiaoxiensis TaxID=766895 RepID=A0ABS2SXV4_9BACI|nr:CYTH domain-containing protein [Shouchella xiaoxiensis]MBM7840363.1 uncharacterized protein YjbK [Shouchella xiaoxiensis]